MSTIVPGILTSSEEDYHKRLLTAEHAADLIQVDIVDGKFANNVTIGPEIVKKYPSSSQLEIQLMVVYPLNFIDEFAKLDYVFRIIVPFEIDADINEAIYQIKAYGIQAGLSLNPETPVTAALHFFDDIDLLLLMTGRPGFSGQKLGQNTYGRIRQSKKINPSLPVEVDIGVNFENAAKLAQAGADFLVASSTLYNAADFSLAYEKLDKAANTST